MTEMQFVGVILIAISSCDPIVGNNGLRPLLATFWFAIAGLVAIFGGVGQ